MPAWIIRAGRGGVYAAEWLEKGCVAVYWDFGGAAISSLEKDRLKEIYRQANPDASPQVVASNVGMAFRFANDLAEGATVVMYNPSTRLYHLGEVTGPCTFVCASDADNDNDSYRRSVAWKAKASRDDLSASAKHSLGSISTLFSVSDDALSELKAVSGRASGNVTLVEDAESAAEAREATAEDGIERIKDRILQLGWEDMELLVAGVLRSMGYKTLMTSKGGDGGRDIVASPDGLGLESPRIIVEVKHRKGVMGAPAIRSFIGGLRTSDSGLYVSTGGFTKEAEYEADRATIPVRLLGLDQFVRLLVDNYDNADLETRAILPLVRIYWPA